MMMEKIEFGGSILAIIVREDFVSSSINFITDDSNELQVGYMSRPKGHVIAAHRHLPVNRMLTSTQEVLIIRKGVLRVDFYTSEEEYVTSEVVKAGDLIVLISGGHGFTVIEPVEIIEVKQGPYCATADKATFEGIEVALVSNEENF